MESNQTPVSKASTPLFPAYTSAVSNEGKQTLFPGTTTVVSNEEVKKDWLCNSSFSDSAFQQVCSLLQNTQEAESSKKDAYPEPVERASVELSIKREKKKKSHKRKAEKSYPDPSSFSVPESDSIFHQLRKKTFIGETGLSFERAFQVDSTREPENLMYDCFERTKIASYYLNLKTPLGLSPKELLSWIQDLPKRKNKNPSRYFSKKFLKLLKNSASEIVHVSKEPVQSTGLNYLCISNSSIANSENTDSGPNFMNVSSSWKSEKPEKEKEKDEKVLTESEDTDLRERTIYYNKSLTEDPYNIGKWIDFVDFQNELFVSEKLSKSNITEKKIAILEKALQHNPKNVKLNAMKLKLSQDLFSCDKVISLWDQLIFFNPNNSEVWQEYFLYILSNLETFSIPKVLKLYSKCIRTLSDVSEGLIESHQPPPDIVSSMLGIFNQFCYILKNCDYTERALATYQALIEFNLFCDPSIEKLSVNERIACLEPFWDSGAQRSGENNAIGWAATVQQKKILSDQISTDSDLNNMEDEILGKKLTVPQTWLEFEKLRAIHRWLPWRPNPEYDQTDDDIDDADRTISFDDVAKYLFDVPREEQKFLLIVHFVSFLGFDMHFLGCHNMGNRVKGNPLNIDDFESISSQITKLIHESVNFISFKDTLWTEERLNFVNNIFSQTVDKFSSRYNTLCSYLWIKFKKYYTLVVRKKNKEDLTNLKKFVKSLLKKAENRNCMLLWFEYISIEWLTDKPNAIKTFQTLLISSTSAALVGGMQFQELWYFTQAFIELLMYDSENLSSEYLSSNEVLWILIHVINKEKFVPYSNQEVKPTAILKTVSVLKSTLEKELNLLPNGQSMLCYCIDPCSFSVINHTKCYAYFQYFYQGCEAAMQVYENVISAISSKNTGHLENYILEQLNVAQARLLNYHTWYSSASLKPLQEFLSSSVKKYPHNSLLLYLLVKLRSASSVINPTRRFLTQLLKDNHNSHPNTWIFALIAEFSVCSSLLFQSDIDGGFQNEGISNLAINWRICSLYEKMLQSDMCAHLPILWRSYLKFEIMTQNAEKAKGIFHRALQNCGWSKELLMDAIHHFPEELNEMLAYMTEKQIRIHTPLEEVTLLMEHAVTDS